ncbi:Polysialic acid transport ATP-binding protein KpsT [Roseovarius litorisediminis]|uniref:Polysialic acid transport ATP-binding protein KpsT n=1 Tax=Roseovarius litorisediminis TaxID=1312363 RepID=A0A1Y5SD35_9RHOB|nr:ATP-binding cassette domain-containing protein [Roseovarius litorisediminis]SLN38018.1 Polysialic acid transport ATP-binding protein KpsT [Roseovarius litorisediminis]
MIALENVTLLKPGVMTRDPILLEATEVFRMGERVGILATPGSGKSSIARLLAGIEHPDRGTIRREARVSWPIGFAGFLHPELGVAENLSLFARLVGVAPRTVIDFCDDFCSIPNLSRKTMKDLPPTQRAMLGYACALSVPGPAMWIADEVITIGEPRDRERCDEILAERLEQGGLVFLSRNARQLKAYCDRFLVLINQRLVQCDDLEVAQEALELSAHLSAQEQMRSEHA